MSYKNLLIKLIPFFILQTNIKSQENNYIKTNIINNLLSKIDIINNNLSIIYKNPFKLNNLNIKLNIYNDNNIPVCFNTMYKLNNKLSIGIDNGISHKFTNFIFRCKSIVNDFSLQLGYTLYGGLHLGIVNGFDESNIEKLNQSAVISNVIALNNTNSDSASTDSEINELVIAQSILENIINDEASESSELSIDCLESTESSKGVHIVIGAISDTSTYISDTESNASGISEQQLENENALITIDIPEYFEYTDDNIQYYKILRKTIRPIIKIETIIEEYGENNLINEDSVAIYIEDPLNNFDIQEYIDINLRTFQVLSSVRPYNILRRIIQPLIRIETIAEGLMFESDSLSHVNGNVQLNQEQTSSIIRQLYENLRETVVYPILNEEFVGFYNEFMQPYINSYIEESLYIEADNVSDNFLIKNILVEEIFTFINIGTGKIFHIINNVNN